MLNWIWDKRYASFNTRWEVYLFTLRDYIAFDFMKKYDGRVLDRKDAVEKGGYIVQFGKTADATKAASSGLYVEDTGATPAENVTCKVSSDIIGGDKFDVEVAAETDLPAAAANLVGKRYAVKATCVVKECVDNGNSTYSWTQVGVVYKLYMTSALASNLVYIGLSRYEDAVKPGEVVTLTYNANTGSGTIPQVKVGKGEAVTVAADTGLTPPTDKTFNSWNTVADGSGVEYMPGDSIELTGDVTLYAIWTE